jgi:hypothetical protein
MKNSEKDDYKVCFCGATIPQRESNKAGVALVFGFIGIIVIGLAFEIQNKLVLFVIAFFWCSLDISVLPIGSTKITGSDYEI